MLIAQPESEALTEWLDETSATVVSSDLLETELRRLAAREELEQADVTRLLEGVALAAIDRAVYRSAGFLPFRHLRALDALHLEAALRLDATAILTFDHRLADAARALGLDVISPRKPHSQ